MKKLLIITTLLLGAFTAQGSTNRIENGQTEDQVIAILGEPEGHIASGNSLYLTYAGMRVKLTDGAVADLPDDFNEKLAETRMSQSEKDAFAKDQEAKGLVLYQGRWLTKEEHAKIKMGEIQQQIQMAKKNMDMKSYTVKRKDGTPVKQKQLVRDNKVTVVFFYASWSSSCKRFALQLKELLKDEDDVETVIIDIKSFDSPTAINFNISAIPQVRVLDAFGRMVAYPTTSIDKVKSAVKQAKKQSRKIKVYTN